MADEGKRFDDLVASLIREELRDGNLDRLLLAHQRAQAALKRKDSSRRKPKRDAAASGKGKVDAEGKPVDAKADAKPADAKPADAEPADAKADVVVAPTTRAEAKLIPPDMKVVPPEVVNAIRSASPKLADQIQASPVDAVFLLTVFMALMMMLQTAMQAYALIHPNAAPPPAPVVIHIFNQQLNSLNLPAGPPPHG